MKFFDTSAAIARVYDVIGDIHGHAALLRRLLKKLGYRRYRGSWRYPGNARLALFVGDYIDRGPEIRETVRIVREMVDSGTARAVMGNHEYNAIGWHSTDSEGRHLRSHSISHMKQHEQTIKAYAHHGEALRSDLAWMRTLPVFFENETIRVVHASWAHESIDWLRSVCDRIDEPLSDDAFLTQAFRRGTRAYDAMETILKGHEITLPAGYSYVDKDGVRRYSTRIRWWADTDNDTVVPMRNIAMPPADTVLGDVSVNLSDVDVTPYTDALPVFIGHYWLTGPPVPLSDRVVCLDYSVGKGGPLCAYRYDGEFPLRRDHFVCVFP